MIPKTDLPRPVALAIFGVGYGVGLLASYGISFGVTVVAYTLNQKKHAKRSTVSYDGLDTDAHREVTTP